MPRTRLDPPNTRPAAGIVPTAAPAEDGGGRDARAVNSHWRWR